MTLKRINRVAIGKLAGTPAWDQVENFAAAAMVGAAYTDLETVEASTLEHDSAQIAITGQRGDGETPAGAAGNRNAAPSLGFYMRGLDMAGGAAAGVNALAAAPQYDMLVEQAAGGAVRNIAGEDVIAGSTRWVLQFGAGRVAVVGYQPADVVGWVNASGKMETAPVVEVDFVGDTITLAGDPGSATGGFSAAPAAADDVYGMRSYSVDQTAGERAHIAVHAQLAQSGVERFFLGCLGSVAFSDADGLLVGTWAAQAHDWKASQELAGPPTFNPFVSPNLGPVSTRGARVLVCGAKSWGLDAVGAHTPSDVSVATSISGTMDLAADIQPRPAVTGTNGRQGFVAVQNGCAVELRLYHDGTTAGLLAGGSQTFGDGALLQFMGTQEVSVLMQFGDQPGATVVLEVPAFQAATTLGEEGGLATLDLSGRGFRPAFGSATCRVHLL